MQTQLRYVGWRVLLMSALLARRLNAQVPSVHTRVVALPQGPVTRIPSPNRHWTLIFECPDYSKERKLWIVENGSHARKLVKEYERSLAIAWAPDSQRFFVEDDYGSNGSDSYVIDPASLKSVDLGTIIASSDPEGAKFLKADHSYLRANRWLDSDELLVVLSGHFDETTQRRVSGSFTVKYQVNLNGGVKKISQRSVEESQ